MTGQTGSRNRTCAKRARELRGIRISGPGLEPDGATQFIAGAYGQVVRRGDAESDANAGADPLLTRLLSAWDALPDDARARVAMIAEAEARKSGA